MDHRHQHFRRIYDESYDDLYRYCLRRCVSQEHAEDVLSEIFVTAWRRLDEVPEPPQARPYLFGIARNLMRNDQRRSATQGRLTERLKHVLVSRSAGPASASNDLAEVIDALHELSESDQEILRLAAWERLPHAQIAEVLGCSVNAVGIRLHRARIRLAEKTPERKLI